MVVAVSTRGDPLKLDSATMTAFRNQPRWVLPALAAVAAVAAALFGWNLGASGLSTYYALAAKAMSESWRALATGAVNPSATITIDKLAGFLVPQALSVRLFGFHAWALALPQAIEGVVTVLASYAIATRWRGPRVGIATAALMTVTPILAAMFGHPTEDAMLTMSLVLAFAAWQRSLMSGRYRWLLLAGVWVAIGFQAKMLQAWMILPALLIGTLMVGGASWRSRLLRVGSVGVITALLSLSWMTAIQLVPPADRPYIDGSTNNNIFSMVFAYNGLDRFAPGLIPGGVPQLGSQTGPHSGAGKGTATGDAAHSDVKLLLPQFTTQDGWLAPAAVAGMLLGLIPVMRRRWFRGRDEQRTGDRAGGLAETDRVMLVTLTVWAVVTAAVFSVIWVPHASYLGAIAFPAALLAVIGAAEAIRLFRTSPRRRDRAVLPALVLVQTLWQVHILAGGPTGLRWLLPIIGVLGIVATILIVLLALHGPHLRHPPSVTTVVVLAVVSSLVAPVVWTSFVLGPGGSGSAADSYAGPHLTTVEHTVGPESAAVPVVRAPLQSAPDPTLSAAQRALVSDLASRNGSRTWLFATDTLPIAVDVLLSTGDDVLPLGGFSQQAPNMTQRELRSLVDSGRLRFVVLSNPREVHPPNQVLTELRSWVRATCRVDRVGLFRAGSSSPQILYDCGT